MNRLFKCFCGALFIIAVSLLFSSCSRKGDDPVDSPQIDAVDLGLSVKWATCNIGATSPTDYGYYFAWGETEAKSTYSWETYKFRTSGNQKNNVKFSKYNTQSSYGTVDNKTVLDPEDDVAHVNLGGKWRMPTDAEWTELREQCTWTDNYKGMGVAGRIVTSKKTGYTDKSIFLPAAGYRNGADLYSAGSLGYYWSSSLYSGYPRRARDVGFNSGDVDIRSDFRYNGFSVRPVLE